MNNLRAFESAGRHPSFKKAADELHVTPAAISQQVRALEDHCGVALASGALVDADLRADRLVHPFPPSVCRETAFSYFLVYPEARARDPKVQAFREWVLSEAREGVAGE